MLEELHIQDFAIIDDIAVRFGPGLNVLTGETGAGKSILIEAIQLLLGTRGRAEQIREGAHEAVVEGLFELSGETHVSQILASQGIEVTEQTILRRVLSRTGKSRAYVNGRFCALQVLSQLGGVWVNIYGQHEHQTLLHEERHLDLLDEYGGLGPLTERWRQLWSAWETLRSEIDRARARREEAEAQRELWEFQREEIERANLQPGEEEDLEGERERLLHVHQIQEGLQRAESRLYGERGSALERVQGVLRELRDLTRVDIELQAAVETLDQVALHMEEVIQRVREHARRVELDPQRLQVVEERLAEIKRLKRKYRRDISEILSLAADVRSSLRELEQGEEDLGSLSQKREETARQLLAAGSALNEARRRWAEVLREGVERELLDLGISAPVFRVELTRLTEGESLDSSGPRADSRGMDRVAFLLSTNVGESPRPLSRIASGGELSRIMLALKKVLAEAERVPTLIFDEIDAGIGGAVAEALGEKLSHIARHHQVLCITHLPQIACYARSHLRVGKEVRGGRTVTRVQPLGAEERVEEISRMLGGRVITEQTRAHARELLCRSV